MPQFLYVDVLLHGFQGFASSKPQVVLPFLVFQEEASLNNVSYLLLFFFCPILAKHGWYLSVSLSFRSRQNGFNGELIGHFQLGKIKRGLLCLLLLPILLKELKSIIKAFGQTCREALLNLFVRLPLYNDTLG
jgi:hypothetical protein